jgi:TonB family protein
MNPSSRVLLNSAIAAFLLESILIIAVGWREHWIAHPQKTTGLDESKFVEAQIFEAPKITPQLTEESKSAAPKAIRAEPTLSKVPGKGKTASPENSPLEEEQNITTEGKKIAPTHGPVVAYAPHPVIPPHLQETDFKTHVVIDFLVNAQGVAVPRLVSSSGNEELDAIAISTVRKWQFRPAEKDHKPIDSKIRLRIVFEVSG